MCNILRFLFIFSLFCISIYGRVFIYGICNSVNRLYDERRRKHDIKPDTPNNPGRFKKEYPGQIFCVTDMDGKVLASTFAQSVCGEGEVSEFANSQADSQVVKGNQYFKIYDDHQLEYILIVDSAGTMRIPWKAGCVPDSGAAYRIQRAVQ